MRVGAETNELRVVAAARRETLRADVQRLEQVRLAGAVLTDREHDPRLQIQLERGVGAIVAERERPNDQPARRIGMIRYEKLSASERIRPGRSGLISRSAISSAVDRLQPVAQELRVEPDLERLARELHGQRLLRLADVLRLRGDRELSLCEAEPERRVALRHHRGAAHDLEKLLARQLHLVLERLGQELLVVRELTVDAARRQPDLARSEHDVVLLDADLELGGVLRDARQLGRARAPGRSPRARRPRLRESVSLTESRYESVAAITSLPPSKRTRIACQHRARLVTRSRASDLRDRARGRRPGRP